MHFATGVYISIEIQLSGPPGPWDRPRQWAFQPLPDFSFVMSNRESEPLVFSPVPGLLIQRIELMNTVSTWILSVRHWLIVTTFAVFYAVLKWVYRRKPDGNDASA